jgi:hypothetical protein
MREDTARDLFSWNASMMSAPTGARLTGASRSMDANEI